MQGSFHVKLVFVFLVIIYFLCALDYYQIVTSNGLTWLIHEQMLNDTEDSFFELLSASAWLCSIILFILVIKKPAPKYQLWWFVFFLLLSFFAFGEEISWGSHLYDYSDELSIVQVNAQKELNMHNLNASSVFGIKEDHFLHYYMSNLGRVLNPIFYVGLTFFWVILPFFKKRLAGFSIFRGMPVPSKGFMLLYSVHAIIFIIVDVFFFNVGQVFEMFISLAAVLVSLEILLKNRQDKSL